MARKEKTTYRVSLTAVTSGEKIPDIHNAWFPLLYRDTNLVDNESVQIWTRGKGWGSKIDGYFLSPKIQLY